LCQEHSGAQDDGGHEDLSVLALGTFLQNHQTGKADGTGNLAIELLDGCQKDAAETSKGVVMEEGRQRTRNTDASSGFVAARRTHHRDDSE